MTTAKGNFEINMTPQQDDEAPAGRFILSKTYQGDVEGTAVGQMISKRIEGGAAVYFAVEEFSGSVNGKGGAFTLMHKGFMDKESQSLEIEIIAGSGSAELTGISGSLKIIQEGEAHAYELTYEL
ncbi:MAG: DUF3224 domain-containing protein [Cyclobacteriaceae bacterium]